MPYRPEEFYVVSRLVMKWDVQACFVNRSWSIIVDAKVKEHVWMIEPSTWRRVLHVSIFQSENLGLINLQMTLVVLDVL